MMFNGLPPCPPKMFDARYPESVEKARVDLSMWIMQLLQHPPIYQSHVFVEFVSAEANVRIFAAKLVCVWLEHADIVCCCRLCLRDCNPWQPLTLLAATISATWT